MRSIRAPLVLMAAISKTLLQGVAFGDELTVVSWGGAYAASQSAAYFEPFEEQTGVRIRLEKYDGGLAEMRRQVWSGTVTWDVVDMVVSDNVQACEEGLLERLDHSILSPSLGEAKPHEDFVADALTECGVGHTLTATVLAVNRRAFHGQRPDSFDDLFDIERFPGRRALQRQAFGNLEWALLSYGVPREELYDLLSTERGLKLAFARLDQIREHIIWWTDGETPVQLLIDKQVVMASGYNGRFFAAEVSGGNPIDIIWDAQLYDFDSWGIVKGSQNVRSALEFIRFATSPESMARLSSLIAYGPTRQSAMALVETHLETGVDMAQHLPSHPYNIRTAIKKDNEWYARVGKRLNQRFFAWLNRD